MVFLLTILLLSVVLLLLLLLLLGSIGLGQSTAGTNIAVVDESLLSLSSSFRRNACYSANFRHVETPLFIRWEEWEDLQRGPPRDGFIIPMDGNVGRKVFRLSWSAVAAFSLDNDGIC